LGWAINFMVLSATASTAASNTTSAVWRYLDVMLPLVPDQRGDGGLAAPQITGKGCERLTLHMRGDVARQIAELGDFQPQLPGDTSKSRCAGLVRADIFCGVGAAAHREL
jgi:hypothetical protein